MTKVTFVLFVLACLLGISSRAQACGGNALARFYVIQEESSVAPPIPAISPPEAAVHQNRHRHGHHRQ